MTERSNNYAIVIILMIIFFLSTLAITTVYTETDAENDLLDSELIKKEEIRTHFRFILPFLTMASFFICCYYIARIIVTGEERDPQVDKFSGKFELLSKKVVYSIDYEEVMGEFEEVNLN